MLALRDLIAHFPEVIELGDGIYRCWDRMPRFTYQYYVKTVDGRSDSSDLLMVSENRVDDDFARRVLSNTLVGNTLNMVRRADMPVNSYGFTSLILAPSDHHAFFGGRLDNSRQDLVLCVPAFECEFAGDESKEEFETMRRESIPMLDWSRAKHPKVIIRFDNPGTGAGTTGDGVLVDFDFVSREIENLNGVFSGFIELQNFRRRSVKLTSPRAGGYLFANHQSGARDQLDRAELQERVWKFLVD